MSVHVRFYGHTIGHGSYANVGNGICSALNKLGRLAGVFPLDRHLSDDAGEPPGVTADIGVFMGDPMRAKILETRGQHRHRVVFLVPNSTRIPDPMVEMVWNVATVIATPSAWAKGIIEAEVARLRAERPHALRGERPVVVWRHAIDAAFTPDLAAHAALVREYEGGVFRVLHLSSSAFGRKGTAELIDAWALATSRDSLGPQPRLVLVTDEPPARWGKEIDESITHVGRLNLSPSEMAKEYQRYHVICQPSRGEGYGCVGPEARACGVPVVLTAHCSGHQEHAPPHRDGLLLGGVVDVPVGLLAPIDDGPDAMAPSVMPEDLASALRMAYASWRGLHTAALAATGARSWGLWSWPQVTRHWLREMEEKGLL